MKLSFGVQIEPQFGFTKETIDQIAVMCENTSFDTLWVSDHMFLNEKSTEVPAFDAWTLMTYLLTKYTTLKVGSLVLCNSYRTPSILAKMITTLDHLSNGRYICGYGAGWKEMEYQAYGIDYPPLSTRIEQMIEGIEVLRAMWKEKEKVSYFGKHYILKDALCFPKPLTKPRLPIWIGSNKGGKKMTRTAAKYGDGFNLAWVFSPSRCKTIFNYLDEQAIKHNRDPKEIARSIGFWVRLYKDHKEKQEIFQEEAAKRNISVEEYSNRVEGALIGTKDEIIQQLRKYLELDVSHFIFMFPFQKEVEYMNNFSKYILPIVK
ncbi:MAG: LLM class flavin-dependent oxidoreductase [Candidatus Heimdallarchaeota archaeon]|nr:MAG: LLM class flavin-dependent oxidoreductase [Candidatus Heimdallarchaeota archaeon]